MAELMSIQVHVPLMTGDVMTDDSGGKLRKVDNDGRSLYQSAKQAVDIEFKDLTYSVSEGRQRGTSHRTDETHIAYGNGCEYGLPIFVAHRLQIRMSVGICSPCATDTGNPTRGARPMSISATRHWPSHRPQMCSAISITGNSSAEL